MATDRAVTSWKGRRTTAVNNFQLAVDKVDPLADENVDLTVQDLEQLRCELEVKFSTYEKAHDKIVGSATPEQLGREDYGNIIAAEHEELMSKREASDQKLRLKIKELDRIAEHVEREALRNQRAQEAHIVRVGRIQILRTTLINLSQEQERSYGLLDAEAERAETYTELCAFHVGFAGLRYRMKQIEERTRELTDLDASLYEEFTEACQTAGQRTSEDICRIQNKLREKVLAHEHKEELLVDLRPVTPPPTPQHVQPEQPRGGTPGMAAPDWEKFATTIAKGIAGMGLEFNL